MKGRWYAVQVATGAEERSAALIARCAELARAAGRPADVGEVFCPRYRTARRAGGRTEEVELPLLPGYLIVETSRPQEVRALIGRVPAFARLLGNDEGFIPLTDLESAWLAACTDRGRRVVGMSEGYVEGGRVTVVGGPLVGREALIERIDRRRGTAYLRFGMCGREVRAKVGLNLVRANKGRKIGEGETRSHG